MMNYASPEGGNSAAGYACAFHKYYRQLISAVESSLFEAPATIDENVQLGEG